MLTLLRLRSTLLATFVGLAVCDPVVVLTIDDANPQIEYSGPWTKNPISDPQNLNNGGSLSLTNTPKAYAIFSFSGATSVSVFGSFPAAGTFNMHSVYTIDGTNSTVFMPPSTISHPEYRQRFFQSPLISPGKHQLMITNLGQNFYFDYIQITMANSPTSSAHPSSTSAAARSGGTSITPPGSSTVTQSQTSPQSATSSVPPVWSSTQPIWTADSTSTASESTTMTSALTSSAPSGPIAALTTSESSSSPAAQTTTAGPQTAAAETQGSHNTIGTGALIAVGVASTALFLCLIGGIFLWRHRKRTQTKRRKTNLTPFYNGPSSRYSEKRGRAGARRSVRRDPSPTSTARLSVPPYSSMDELRNDGRSNAHSSTSAECVPGHNDERTGSFDPAAYETLASQSPVSPQRRHESGTFAYTPANSPVATSPATAGGVGKERRWRNEAAQEKAPRRSLDGGVRIAGGPQADDEAEMNEDEVRSTATLPPLYQQYHAL